MERLMAEYLHELRPTTHFTRLDAVAAVLAALNDAELTSPEDRAARFETLLRERGYAVVEQLPTFPGRAIR